MSFSGGVFSINSSGQPVITGTVISSTVFNALTADLATGLSTAILKDGTQVLTANIPMGNFKLTGLAAGTAAGNSLRYEQLFNASGITLIGNLLFTDASFDIGASGATRPRDLFLSRNAVIGGTLNVTGHPTLEGVTATGATGSGLMVFATSPTLTTAVLGSSTATTHAAADNSTKLATTAYVDRAAGGTLLTNSLSGDVALNNVSNYFDGPTVAQGTTGTWFASGTVVATYGGSSVNISAKLWDGTTVIASAQTVLTAAITSQVIALSGYLASPADNIRISLKADATNPVMSYNASGNSKDSTISVIRVA